MQPKAPTLEEDLKARLSRLTAERPDMPKLDWAGGGLRTADDMLAGWQEPRQPQAAPVPPLPAAVPQTRWVRPAPQAPQPSPQATARSQASSVRRAPHATPTPQAQPAPQVQLAPQARLAAEPAETRELTPAERVQLDIFKRSVDDQFATARAKSLCNFTRATARLLGAPEGAQPEWLAAEIALYSHRKRELLHLIGDIHSEALRDEAQEAAIDLFVEANDLLEAQRMLESVRDRQIVDRIVARHLVLDWRLRGYAQPAGNVTAVNFRGSR